MTPCIDVIRARELGPAERATWAALVVAGGPCASPFFHVAYHRLLDDVAADVGGLAPVEVAVVRADGVGASAFWPFQRQTRRHAGPAGGRLTDYQGVIGAQPADFELLLRAAGLDDWRFDHVPAEQGSLALFAVAAEPSPRIDLRAPAEPWRADGRFSSSLARKRRKLEREHGAVTFEAASREPDALAALARWKSGQYIRTGKQDLFALAWARELFERLLALEDDDLGARLSVLRAGDEPVAVHLGLHAASVWHYWLPAYDPHFDDTSPGMLLLREMCDAAPTLGADVIDLGRGRQPYKLSLANTERMLNQGVARRSNRSATLRRVSRRASRAVTRRLRPQR